MLVKIYLPTIKKDGTFIGKELRKRWENALRFRLCREFGGCTSYEGTGAWLKNDSTFYIDVCKENVTVFESYTNEVTPKKRFEIVKFCERLKRNLYQDCIAYVIDNEINFV